MRYSPTATGVVLLAAAPPRIIGTRSGNQIATNTSLPLWREPPCPSLPSEAL